MKKKRKKTKTHDSRSNYMKYIKGHDKLKYAILAHPEENESSIFDYIKSNKSSSFKVKLFDDKYGKVNENAEPGIALQVPFSVPSDMDTFSLVGPSRKSNKKKKSNKRIMTFDDFIKKLKNNGK